LCSSKATTSRITRTSGPRSMTAANEDRSAASENILEDSKGHINRELAERIWNWEQEHRSEKNLPKVEYSVRAGLRLVDSMVGEILRERSSNNSRISDENNSNVHSDLIQEGLTALLMDAMSHYREEQNEAF